MLVVDQKHGSFVINEYVSEGIVKDFRTRRWRKLITLFVISSAPFWIVFL